MKAATIVGITPFEMPDVNLALQLSNAKAFPVLHLGRDHATAVSALTQLSSVHSGEFGVCMVSGYCQDVPLPAQVSMIVLPWGLKVNTRENVKLFYQVHTLDEAMEAMAAGAGAIVVKGNEGAGKVGYESSFVLFQRIIAAVKDIDVYVQGGVGIHTAAAVMALGARGVVLDSQLALFPEAGTPSAVRQACEKLSGNETRLFGDFRVLVRPNSPAIDSQATEKDIENYLHDFDLENSYLPLGQDIAIATDLVSRYKKLDRLIPAIHESVQGHLKQAKALNIISPGNALAKDLNITFPIAQGPMTRVSDVAPFADAVAAAGALPFIALSLLKGGRARDLIHETKTLAGNKTWGVGILGFAPQELREEQMEYIKEAMPPVVLIAGGRPSQAKSLEKLGIKTFLHVPSVSLLDMFLKEGARRFVFEGRECGGHVGPLSGMVLWEKQIERLLLEDHPEEISVFFAGGIHDARSASFIAVMVAPLAARGIKVGVLMGTSYLYTEEAVSTGAILARFQEQAMQASDTVLLETAPGHETRCLKSPFAEFFNLEKEKLSRQGIDKKEIWAQLETLNVGRLRIAAKGIERRGDELKNIADEEQLQLGMYMIGQVAAICNTIMSIQDLHRDVAEGNYSYIENAALLPIPGARDKSLNVAIIGMECIFPGAKNIDEYWRNIVLGADSITEVPDERWNKSLYYNPESADGDMSHSKWGGFIPLIDFDPLEFGIPPKSLAAIEPTQLLTLLVAKRALEKAGYQDGGFNAENVSVIIGAEGGNDLANSYSYRCYTKQVFGEMPAELDQSLPRMTEDSFPGILANVISGRITNRLNLGGRNFTVDAACASSLAALDLACQELVSGKSDMVLTGGADLHNGINDYLMFSSTHALSRKGKCATFDAGADGIALGEGIAIVVLKRHEDALRDGDTIYSVIQGIGGSSDGKSLGLTAPRKSGQVKALERAYAQAGISPSALGLVEAHGTGTVVGDRTELSALTDMLNQSGATAGQTYLGSVKTQIGHTKCAAGLAGLIKASLSAYYGIRPPTINLKVPNDYYNPSTSPFAFHTAAGLWMDDDRKAGVSAFGFGGTNFHAVIESSHVVSAEHPVIKSWPAELFVFKGSTYDEARIRLSRVKALLEENDSIDLKNIAYSLALSGNSEIQLTIVASSAEDLSMKIDLALSGVESHDTFITKRRDGKVAFMFPGQGSQRINMARDLFVIFPAMRRLLSRYPDYEKVLFPNAVFEDAALKAQKEKIKDTRMAQPLLGMVDLALANFLRELGIEPDMVAGHSYGELAALCFAGAFAEDQLVPLSEQRAAAILGAVTGEDPGAMIAVNSPKEDIFRLIEGWENVYAVNYNSPSQIVFAGTTAAIKKLGELLKTSRISFRPLEVACAFHSPLVAKSSELYQEVLKGVSFNQLSLPVWSNTTATLYPEQADAVKERLCSHLVQPVKFADQIMQMYEDGARVFIEVGPGKVLSTLTKACLGKDELLLHTEDQGTHKMSHLLCTIASYLASGRTIKLARLFEGRDCVLLDLDDTAKYKKSPAIWLVNGQHAYPSVGALPSYGAPPIVEPVKMKINETKTEQVSVTAHGTELMMQEYLNSMKMMIQAQRDVMLQFLGQHVPAARPMDFPQHFSQPLQAPELVLKEPAAQHIEIAFQAPVIHLDVNEILLQIVSDKTGYPQEMLGMEMDLEADLSIDSIKRMEIIGTLRTALGGFNHSDTTEDAFMEQLSGIKTLSGLLGWINENAVSAGGPAAAEQTEITVKVDPHRFSVEDIQSALLHTVSEKTGYPQEMLGMDLDMEADLSIDSIKRMEIISEMKEKVGFRIADNDTEDLMEKLAAIKTLSGLVSLIAKIEAESFEPVTAAKKIIEESTPAAEQLYRLRFELKQSALGDQNTAALKDSRFAITGEQGAGARAIKSLFEEHGVTADLVPAAEDLKGYQGLIILNLFNEEHQRGMIDYIEMIKALDFDQFKWVYFVSDTQSTVDASSDPGLLRRFQGYAGLFKSLDKEYENTKCRIISLKEKLSAADIAAITLNEILNPDQPAEVVYQGNVRHTIELVPSELSTGDAPVELGKDAVVLVLGGGQGITSNLVMHLAKDYPCRYILVGRSSDPRANGQEQFSSLKTKDEIRDYLIRQGELRKPADIERETNRIDKANQILETISSLQKSGSAVSYVSLDLRDEEELSRLITGIYEEYGRLDGVIHGAGLLEDKLFHAKSVESFQRVFDTKVTPLRVLAEQLRPETQFMIFFSSIASVYGNRGQTDYAAANSVMDRYAWALKEKISGKVMAINWGPWKGAGMVSATLEKEYERRGIALIPLQEGMEKFVDELKYGKESQVLIMAGNQW